MRYCIAPDKQGEEIKLVLYLHPRASSIFPRKPSLDDELPKLTLPKSGEGDISGISTGHSMAEVTTGVYTQKPEGMFHLPVSIQCLVEANLWWW